MGEEDLTGRTLLGKYKVVGLVGQGGMGLVWRGVHVRTGRKLAIKMLDSRFLANEGVVQRFGREARAASAIQHPGIVEVLDLDQTEDGIPFLVMELLVGEVLSARIESRGRMTQAETLDVFAKLLSALDAAHAHGVVHRDLKPDNIFLVPDRRGGETVKILDFGISQKDDERIANLTVAGSVLGTPHYMAPEQAMGDADVDARVDIYAAGVVMYECLVGDVPFDANNYNALIHVILNDEPVPPSQRGAGIEPGVERVILRALSKEKGFRPQTAGAMLGDLEDALGGKEGFAQATSPNARTPGPASRAAAAGAPAVSAAATQGAASVGASEVAVSGSLPSIGDLVIPEGEKRRSRRGMQAVAKAKKTPSAPPPDKKSTPAPAGPQSMRGGTSDPLSFEAAFDAAAAGSSELELDEAALTASVRPTPRSMRPSTASTPDPTPGPPAGRRRQSSGRMRPVSTSGIQPPGSESERPPPKKKIPKAVWYGLGGLAIFGLLVLGLRLAVRGTGGDDDAPVHQPVEVTQPDNPGAGNIVRVDVAGLPAGASLELDGLPAGSLPMRVRRGTSHTLVIHAPGYESREIAFTADRDKRLSANLRPQEGAGVQR